MSSIILKPDELRFIALMIDKRDSAHLSGHTTDAFSGRLPEWRLSHPVPR